MINSTCILVAVQSFMQTASGDDAELRRFDFERVEMGVIFRLSVYGSDSGVANKAAEAAYARVHELNGIFSDYDGSSEIRRLCETSRPGNPVPVSKELYHLFEASLKLSRQSNGAFDVTVGPLTKLWRRARRREELPAPERIAAERMRTGFQLVRMHPDSQSVELLSPEMRIDFGGIAKGFAADEALSVLSTHGFNRALVDASGDIVAGDPPPGEEWWTVAIESLKHKPASTQSDLIEPGLPIPVLRIRNQSVATSGDAYQSVSINGRRYSHIVDPQTGFGLNQRSSVTIIAPTGMLADGLASAVSVLGPVKGIQLIEQPIHRRTEAYIMFAAGESDDIEFVWSSGLHCLINRKSQRGGAVQPPQPCCSDPD